MHDRDAIRSNASNCQDCFLRILKKDSPDLDNRCHEVSPNVGSHPNMRFRFCTAWPAAPLTRLSMTETITVFAPLLTTPMKHKFVRVTPCTFGGWPGGSTRTKGDLA